MIIIIIFFFQIPGVVGFFGKGGMTAEFYNKDKYNAMKDFRPDVVFLNLGGNDIRSDSKPSDIASNVLNLVRIMKQDSVKTVYYAEICERGKFPKDKKLTKKCFNSQRRKINKIIDKSGAVKFVTLSMRFPKDYSADKTHFSKPSGMKKYLFSVRRVLMSHRSH